jgi:pimeloyl-ACP methyl ester carboxylesterase
MTRLLPPALALGLLVAAAAPAPAQKETVAEITTRGQMLRFLLIKPAKPIGSVILLAGGHGILDLAPDGKIGWGAGNQLVRTRAEYAKAGFVTATPDVTADLKAVEGGVPEFRWSKEYATDLGALVKHLRGIAAPVYLIGNSRAGLSVPTAAVRLTGEAAPDAIVITSGQLVHIDDKQPSAEKNAGRLERIKQPTLLVYHAKDACPWTPASSAERFRKLLTGAKKVEIKFLKGGAARGDPCESRHYHGFEGIDGEVVKTIADWLKSLKGPGA